jgi:hypothetical protein
LACCAAGELAGAEAGAPAIPFEKNQAAILPPDFGAFINPL